MPEYLGKCTFQHSSLRCPLSCCCFELNNFQNKTLKLVERGSRFPAALWRPTLNSGAQCLRLPSALWILQVHSGLHPHSTIQICSSAPGDVLETYLEILFGDFGENMLELLWRLFGLSSLIKAGGQKSAVRTRSVLFLEIRGAQRSAGAHSG